MLALAVSNAQRPSFLCQLDAAKTPSKCGLSQSAPMCLWYAAIALATPSASLALRQLRGPSALLPMAEWMVATAAQPSPARSSFATARRTLRPLRWACGHHSGRADVSTACKPSSVASEMRTGGGAAASRSNCSESNDSWSTWLDQRALQSR